MKGNWIWAGIVREGNKKEEGLKVGLEDHRWLQERRWEGYGSFPVALVPSWEWHERRQRGRKASDMSQELSSCRERIKMRFGMVFKITLRNPRLPSFLDMVPTFVLQSARAKYPTGSQRAFERSFARGERYPQVFRHPWSCQPQKPSSLWFRLWIQKILTQLSARNNNKKKIVVFLKLKISSLLSL